MNVALEVSTIGLGMTTGRSAKNRTGIYRVTTMLSESLILRNDINTFLLFWEFPHTSSLGTKYFLKKGYREKYLPKLTPFEIIFYNKMLGINEFPLKTASLHLISKIIQFCQDKSLLDSIDIFHSFYYPNPECIDPKKKVRFRTIHDILPLMAPRFFTQRDQKRFRRNIEKSSFDYDWFFAVSNSTKNDFCEYFRVPSERVFVNHLAASRSTFYPEKDEEIIAGVQKKIKIPTGSYFLSVATLEPRKNIRFVLNCFRKIILSHEIEKDCYLVLVGRQGWMISNTLNSLRADPTLKSRVIIPGFVEDQFLSALYSGALAFLYPSLYEGFGLPVLEAMQCGSPVITSNKSSLLEVVGDAAILIDPEKEEELCGAMVEIAKNWKLRNELSEKGIERASSFSWDKAADRTVEAYRFAINNNRYL